MPTPHVQPNAVFLNIPYDVRLRRRVAGDPPTTSLGCSGAPSMTVSSSWVG